MKLKLIFGLLSILLVIFTILLFIPDSKNLKIITSPKVFSIFKSSEVESFTIQLLVNQNSSYYFDDDYISKVSLSSEFEDEIIPLVLEDISYSSEIYPYENENFYFIDLSFQIGFDSNEYLISFDKAYLDIRYSNEEEIKLYIGEFNYLFDNEVNRELSINNLYSTVHKIDELNNVSGIFIELNNISNENLILNQLSLGSSNVVFNNYYLSEVFNEPDLFDEVEDILLIDDLSYITFNNDDSKNILLLKDQSIMLFVPISYLGDIKYIHRFYFEVVYENNEGVQKMIIDDFPYINTSIFQKTLEKDYHVYEIYHQDN